MNWQPGKCKPGDVIRVNLGILHHYGIFVSEDEVIAFGLPPIPENRRPQTEVTVLSTDIDTFACGKIVEIASFTKEEKAKKFSPGEITARARARIGESGYNLIHNN
ncbi:MAG: lecithin retinol acyltransferase family protein, partial [Clostridia bacterium]|nr:lecithin retinol acyltransferase family protein [Clostridia bacterium]